MNITFTDANKSSIFVIPVVPPDLEIKTGSSNEVFQGILKDLNIIGNPTLKEFSISSFFPVNKDYSFVAQGSEENGWKYVSFLEEKRNAKQPIRVVVTTKDKHTVLNSLMSIESFVYSSDKIGDIQYELSLREFTDSTQISISDKALRAKIEADVTTSTATSVATAIIKQLDANTSFSLTDITSQVEKLLTYGIGSNVISNIFGKLIDLSKDNLNILDTLISACGDIKIKGYSSFTELQPFLNALVDQDKFTLKDVYNFIISNILE